MLSRTAHSSCRILEMCAEVLSSQIDFSRFIEGECTTCPVDSESLSTFLKVNEERDRFIGVVTSGGTRAALEKRMVRCLENFSTGLRGARITECLLDLRYSVVLLMRRGSLMPYARHYTIQEFRDMSLFRVCNGEMRFTNETASTACHLLHKCVVEKRLMVVEYDSVQEYLFALSRIATLSAKLEQRVMFCLAAAVSDYFVPRKELFDHKLSSDSEMLTLTLRKVPKCLGLLNSQWAPNAFVISFKVRPHLVHDSQSTTKLTNAFTRQQA